MKSEAERHFLKVEDVSILEGREEREEERRGKKEVIAVEDFLLISFGLPT